MAGIYDSLVDKTIVFQVSELFYEKVYKHPWISLYFKNTDQKFITQQQTDFVVGALGGPKNFSGRLPVHAHPHMLITEELFDLRKKLLTEAMEELKAPTDLKEAWLQLDEAFRSVLVRSSVTECEKRYATDEILAFDENANNLYEDFLRGRK